MEYSEVFKNLKQETVKATKELVKNGIWKNIEDQDKAIIMGLWIQKVAKIYDIEPPKFFFVTGKEGERLRKITGGGEYISPIHTIYLYEKASLVTLLHEFRHAMQYALDIKMHCDDPEEDARAWSLSLFKVATPEGYKNAVKKGILHFS